MRATAESGEAWPAERLFAGPGESLERFRKTDWSATPLGPVESWPAELRMAVRTVLPSEVPMLLWWGPQLVQIFNDAIIPVLGDKYPGAVAQPAPECWHEVWDEVGARVERAMAGTATFAEEELLFMQRHGYEEETYWTFSYSPIRDESGEVAGVFVATTDVTSRVLGERRLEALSRLGTVAITDSGMSVIDTCRNALDALAPSRQDIPLAALFLDARVVDPEDPQSDWKRLASIGTKPGFSGALLGPDEDRLLSKAATASEPIVVSGIAERFPDLLDRQRALGDHPIDNILLAPLRASGHDAPLGVLAVGLSPYRVFDAAYATFAELVVTKISGLLRDASAMDAERRRADAFAALDAAKTRFLESISHEFRTPLTLLLGPLQSVLDDATALTDAQRQSLEAAQRAAVRLRRLVDALLDVTRAEADLSGKSLTPSDPAALTAECVELFADAAQRAGLELRSRIAAAAAEQTQLDPQLWAHIVLNLLSNAIKYTPAGSVDLDLDVEDDRLVLTVADTGLGIPEAELGRIFERFHRVENAGGRSQEGIGLGLSLVSDWVHALGGSVTVSSELGRGSTFTVSVPRVLGPVSESPAGTVPGDLSALYVGEAHQWDRDTVAEAGSSGQEEELPQILVIEDNADMRDYLMQLLRRENWHVDAVGDSDTALERIRSQPPHLVLSDIMMPGRDGVALLEEIRKDPTTSRLPVILLTARAGAEAAIGGLRTGADDYITKPFDPGELVARVRVNLELSWLREQLIAAQERESDQLKTALETRSTLSKAVGLMMATFECDSDTAFEKLVAFSQHRNVKVREIAEQIVGDYTASLTDSST
ncbi:response regulator [Rhodococcus gordoniae]|uniref:histidine kinase n=1 Tax=Rhodococcus gordoniae TaxID=223392 RepID=A0A379M420_9NOCA|nr:response regulator [Rhodococcus gordoniae]SUE16258.1 response regulator [Rhodococcus gordoniae]